MEENNAEMNREKMAARLRTVKRIVSVVVFIAIFAVLYGKVNTLLRSKAAMENVITLYDEPRDTLDVIFAGTSHPLKAFYCLDMWDRQGFTSFNTAQNGQMLPVTYYCVEEALRLQHPKVVVVDLYYAVKDGKYGSISFTHETLDNLRWSPVKLRAILDTTKRSQWKEMIFPTIIYHSRWNELTTKDFTMATNPRRGSGLSYTIKPAEIPEIVSTDASGGMGDASKEYLIKIIELCEKKGVSLVFTIVPYSIGNDSDSKSAEEQLAIFNEAKELADRYGIPYIDFFEHLDELGIDFETDFYDQTHMNAFGAEKVSAYMADWLVEHYDLPDHREDENYARWADDYKRYVSQKRSARTKELQSETDIVSYFTLLAGEKDYLVLLNIGGRNTSGLSDRAVEAMRACGIKTDLRELNEDSWVAVLDKKKNVYEERSPDKIQYEGTYEGLTVKLFSYKGGTYFNTIIDDKKVGPNKAMLNVVVYSISQKKVVDSVAFDIGKESCAAVRP